MELDEEMTYSSSPSHATPNEGGGFLNWRVQMYSALVVTGIIGLGLWSVWDKLIYLGYFLMGLIGLMGLMAVAATYIRLRQMVHKPKVVHIGSGGTILVNPMTGKVTTVAPQAALAQKAARESAAFKPTTAEQVVPKLSELLAHPVLFPGQPQILLGFREDNTPKWGTMDGDIKTVGIGGRGRSGKTNTMFFLTVQHLFQYSEVWLADPHASKNTGLFNMLGPLARYVRVADTIEEMRMLFHDLENEIKARKAARAGTQFRRLIIICDEWNGILEDFGVDAEERDEDNYAKTVASLIIKVEREMAGYEIYAMVGVHSWMDRDIGGTSLRRLIHSVLCHRMPEEYSRHILPKKWASQTEGLRTGHAMFKDNEGYCEKVLEPHCTPEDAYTAAQMLEAAFAQQQEQQEALSAREVAHLLPQQTTKQSIHEQRQRQQVAPPPEDLDEEVTEEELADRDGAPEVILTTSEESEFLQAAMQLFEENGKKPGRVAVMKRAREIALAQNNQAGAMKWNKKNWARIIALGKKFNI